MRFAIDTGGTFTDLLVEDDDGRLQMFKASTTPSDPIKGVLDALTLAAETRSVSLREMLSRGTALVYGTTHPINAIITGKAARTAFLTTAGHPDILRLREGGRTEPFNFTVEFPTPLVPRSLTWEVPGRIMADGRELEPLDEDRIVTIAGEMRNAGVQAVAVCLLWSVINPDHEQRIGQLLAKHLPGIDVTLSHELNPTLREYRRASSACIDASLKPMMSAYMDGLARRLTEAGFGGRVLVVTSQGGVVDASNAAKTPIHLINSGPSMAPVSGGFYAELDEGSETVIVADTGGTTYDVSLVRNGRLPMTRESWIGLPYRGHMTGFPTVDVKSVGAGGGSIAWIDDGGMLHVGPQSASSVPGPVCYGRGGTRPTLTDAAVVLGYVDPDFFLGGAMRLDAGAARRAIEMEIARPLGKSVEEAAVATVLLATENMVQAIFDITVNQGIDPRKAVLVGGGGAAGLNSVLIARRLEARRLLIPEVGAALSAAGAIMSDLKAQIHALNFTRTDRFDRDSVNETLDELERKARTFLDGPGKGALGGSLTFMAEARYPDQVWEIEVPGPASRFLTDRDVATFAEGFHRTHDEIFAVHDTGAAVEVLGWSVLVSAQLRQRDVPTILPPETAAAATGSRLAYFPDAGRVETRLRRFDAIATGEDVEGPAIIESSFTTVVVNPGAVATKRPSGSLSIDPGKA